jgi:translation initiation factor eIF-2B subunit alpha
MLLLTETYFSFISQPFYIVAESDKFARLYPLRQSDLPLGPKQNESSEEAYIQCCDTTSGSKTKLIIPSTLDPAIQVHDTSVDFTPSTFITLLFTDLGVLTPSAVSYELIRLYQ